MDYTHRRTACPNGRLLRHRDVPARLQQHELVWLLLGNLWLVPKFAPVAPLTGAQHPTQGSKKPVSPVRISHKHSAAEAQKALSAADPIYAEHKLGAAPSTSLEAKLHA